MSESALGKAVSKIHNNLINSLNYITNPKKTEGTLLVSGMGCSTNPKLARNDFKRIAEKFNKNKNKNINNVLAHHYLISFNPSDNIPAEKAHELSLEIMNKFLGKKYKALVATHNDKEDHIHTHVIFNSTGNNGKKYEAMDADLLRFKEIINEVCNEHDLTPINLNKAKDKTQSKAANLTYKQWLEANGNKDDKKVERFEYIEQVINRIFKENEIKSLEQLERLLKKVDVKILYKNKATNELYKNITFKSKGWERGFRGKFEISLENIIDKIRNNGKDQIRSAYQEWSYKNHSESYKDFIKESIDNSVDLLGIENIDDLAKYLKDKCNIQMDYLNSYNKPLKRIKFLALDSKQKNKLGSASLNKDDRDKYEYAGLQGRCSKKKEVSFSNDLVANLQSIQKYLIKNNKEDRWGLDEGIDVLLRRNLKTKNDLLGVMKDLGKKIDINSSKIKFLDENMKEIENLYDEIIRYNREYQRVKDEVDNLKGFASLLNKAKLEREMNQYKDKIQELKNSEYYSNDKKYSDIIHEITDEKYFLIEENRRDDRDIEVLSKIEYVETHKETICGLTINDMEKKEIYIENDVNDTL